jgi:hypothetical protein
MEYLEAFAKHSRAWVHYLHVTHEADPIVDLECYDAVLLSYCARLCFDGYVSERFLELLDRYSGVKAIAIQDEYDFVEAERRGLDRLKPHVVFTCIPPDQRESIYPSERYPGTEFVQVLTGYVPERFADQRRLSPISERPIHLGYRGRDIGARYGELGRMKFDIGRVFGEAAASRGVPSDIAMDEASRIYGEAWYQWLGKCRCVLGSESGSNVFDFDGSIAQAFSRQGTEPVSQAIRDRVNELDRTFRMGQISARVFEATVMRSALVLYEGRYSDAIRPMEHYVPVAHDHSNLDEVFRVISDTQAMQAMVDRSYTHLIGSGRFGYRAFVEQVDDALACHMAPSYRGGEVSVAPTHTDADCAPLEERPTAAPRGFDSFQLRALRAQLTSPTHAIQSALASALRQRVSRRMQSLIPAPARAFIRGVLG